MIERRFDKAGEMIGEITAQIVDHLTRSSDTPYAAMLSGGTTPLPTYGRIAAHPPAVPDKTYVVFTDERMVPTDSPDSNFGNARKMIAALRLPAERVLRVHTEKSAEEAAEHYQRDLEAFFRQGGRIGLGFLGLGSDGHTASLFSRDDVRRGGDRWAIPVLRAKPPERVSVTSHLLSKVESLVFALAGPEKEEIAKSFLEDPEKYPAGLAVADARNVEVWFCPESLTGS
ncbi:6-phosphogluconolactonase [Candidatus Sumerlaeota bacterium]|nr:6-phosphogluconolactonase [Candidatus Sumerlaeota bacterium]